MVVNIGPRWLLHGVLPSLMGCSQRRLNFFHDFHAKGYFEKSLNAMFVTVIPKKSGAVDIKDFLPVCLVSGVYKVLANVLENK